MLEYLPPVKVYRMETKKRMREDKLFGMSLRSSMVYPKKKKYNGDGNSEYK